MPAKSNRPYCYQYPHPAVTVDCVIFGLAKHDLQVLLIQRKHDPFGGCWAIPGGFVNIRESLEVAAQRELKEETGVSDVYLEQFHTFGNPGRDPRERVISVAYFALVRQSQCALSASSDARDARWFSLAQLPRLAFDHDQVLAKALDTLRERVRRAPTGFELLPAKFKLPQLQRLYEIILGRALDKRNFRRQLLASGLLLPLAEFDCSERRRPARLYRFDRRRYRELQQIGFTLAG